MADERYNPPVQVGTKEITLLSLVQRVDPMWSQGKFWEREYPDGAAGWGGRGKFHYANPYHRGPYAD